MNLENMSGGNPISIGSYSFTAMARSLLSPVIVWSLLAENHFDVGFAQTETKGESP